MSDHYAELSLECWSAEPPAPDPAPYPAWEAVAEAPFRAASGSLESSSGLLLEMGAHRLEVAPGTYALRAWTAGADAANEREANGEFMPRGAERWVVRLWRTGGA
ncbi:hypothetical protein [Streptomyces sp. NRRL F-5126]|uniref:hypothetical protein n=1 Tax=Streptomyces sp. NRRL F-5126 TaxID=1463857 RepID=UPI0004CA9D65|nr:hypothetical protein [Streptomyces sp. NRRL F-5126]